MYSLLAFLSLTIFGILHLTADHTPRIGYLELGCAAVMLLNIGLLYASQDLVVGRTILLSTIMAGLVVMLGTGGTQGTGIFWFFVFPVGAFFVAGKKQGMRWVIALFLVVLALLGLAQADVVNLFYSFITIRQLLVSLAVVAAGIYVYERSREQLEQQTRTDEHDLREEKVLAGTILENIDEGVVAINKQGRVILMNQPAEQMLGWSRDDLMGKKFVEMVPLIDHKGKRVKSTDRPIHRALEGPIGNLSLTYVRKDGSKFPVVMSGRSIMVDGKVQGAIGTFRDVTEERNIDRAKTEFVTLASHQLRTPLSAIAWFSEMLLNGDVGKLSDAQREPIEQIYHSNQRSAAIVDAMLTVSNVELDKVTVSPEVVDLPALCHKVLNEVGSALLSEKELHIREEYAPDLSNLKLDPALTKTMLQIIISNALKYTPNGGSVTIKILKSAEKLSLSSRGSVRIDVTDTGYGVPKAEHKKIFEKLFRGTNIRSKDTDGTGLGLYIVKSLLEQAGGVIRFTSEEDKGSTFSIVLPLEGMKRKGPGTAHV